jgi:hypothetical protein
MEIKTGKSEMTQNLDFFNSRKRLRNFYALDLSQSKNEQLWGFVFQKVNSRMETPGPVLCKSFLSWNVQTNHVGKALSMYKKWFT